MVVHFGKVRDLGIRGSEQLGKTAELFGNRLGQIRVDLSGIELGGVRQVGERWMSSINKHPKKFTG